MINVVICRLFQLKDTKPHLKVPFVSFKEISFCGSRGLIRVSSSLPPFYCTQVI